MSGAVEEKQIFGLLQKVRQDVGRIGKDQQGYGYKFRGVDDVWNRYGPVLARHGVAVSTTVSDLKTEVMKNKNSKEGVYASLRLQVNFFAPDGSHIQGEAYGASWDSEFRSVAQAHSDAYKKVFFEVFMPPVDPDADDDPDKRQSAVDKDDPPPQSTVKVKVPDDTTLRLMTKSELEALWYRASGDDRKRIEQIGKEKQ